MATWTVACMSIAIGLLSLVGQYAILASVPSLYARSRPSNVVILIQLYQKIKRTDCRVKVCFLTASEFYHEEIRKEEGFDGFNKELFLRKPIEIASLVDAIKTLLNSN